MNSFSSDYVDRGRQNIETISLMFCYKIKYPENFFLLRGNHECPAINRVYGFFEVSISLFNDFLSFSGVQPSLQIDSPVERVPRHLQLDALVWTGRRKDLVYGE
jgi:hypothetical protein